MNHFSHLFEVLKNLITLEYLPNLTDRASLGLMFLFGLLTSFHCIGMCGGIVMSNSIKKRGVYSTVAYNAGRIISYTVIGGIAGSLGFAVGFTGIWKGAVPIVGGVFMVLLAAKYLNIFKGLRRLNIAMPGFLARKIFGGKFDNTFIIGLLSGFMPCGPLQMVQLYALGTKSLVIGAISAFVFSLGTVPVLFGFGLLNSVINKKHTLLVTRVSAVIMLILGAAMLGRGLALTGIDAGISGIAYSNDTRYVETIQNTDVNIQIIDTELQADKYPEIVVKKGIPVKWNLKATEETLNDCNNAIIIPKLKIEKRLNAGDNYIEFTPRETGEIVYTCWMGMIKSKIKVID